LWDREKAIAPGGAYALVLRYSALLAFEIGAHALRATAATDALDHEADIAKVQECLAHANISTTRIYDHRKTSQRSKLRLDQRHSDTFFTVGTIVGMMHRGIWLG
jgi:site-specific recombinase XerD